MKKNQQVTINVVTREMKIGHHSQHVAVLKSLRQVDTKQLTPNLKECCDVAAYVSWCVQSQACCCVFTSDLMFIV